MAVLLLDDVMSELDPARREQLIRRLEGVQVVLTCTDASDLAGAPIAKLYAIRAGEARCVEGRVAIAAAAAVRSPVALALWPGRFFCALQGNFRL